MSSIDIFIFLVVTAVCLLFIKVLQQGRKQTTDKRLSDSASCSHFRTCQIFWPHLASVNISGWYLKRFQFKSYNVDKRTYTVKQET